MNELLLVRHGETEWNLAGRRQGLLDSPLTPKGRLDALTIARSDVVNGVDTVFTSPLGRARATATIIATELGLTVTVVRQLAEIDHGDMSGLTNEEIEGRFPGELARRSTCRYTWRFPNGESYEDGSDRAREALRIIADSASHKALVVSHEMISRMMLGVLIQLTPDEALRRSLGHRAIMCVDVVHGNATEIHLDQS